MALLNRAIKVRLATSILYDTLMKNCFKDWNQSTLRKLVNMQITLTSKSTKPAISFQARLITRYDHTDTHARTQWEITTTTTHNLNEHNKIKLQQLNQRIRNNS